MWYNGLEGNKPSVIVRNTTNAGGDMIVFDLGKVGVVKFRLQCGYQPVDVSYWPTPDKPPVPDNPEPEEPEPEEPTPGTEPKDRDAGPQVQGAGQPGSEDFTGGQNHDNDTTQTSEPQSPSSYTPPAPPKNEGSSDRPAENKPSGGQNNSHNNGNTENHGGQNYEVTAGDGQNHSNLDTVQEEQHDHNTVETPVKDDGVNQGDPDPDDVE
ncbi:hypothetical protein IKQ38_03550 [Candidatus Saccharibacteria bacterium]|nr:hypothetical protein [Candidatus Saccharibacteria bacterium]